MKTFKYEIDIEKYFSLTLDDENLEHYNEEKNEFHQSQIDRIAEIIDFDISIPFIREGNTLQFNKKLTKLQIGLLRGLKRGLLEWGGY